MTDGINTCYVRRATCDVLTCDVLTRADVLTCDVGALKCVRNAAGVAVAEYLPSYAAALERGWSPDNTSGQAGAIEQMQRIAAEPDLFIASLVDREAAGDPIILPDGTAARRLPGYQRWLWDGEFCGRISLRWQPGTEALPPHCLGHIGYSVVPWKRRRGYATRALREMLPEASAEGLHYVEITTATDNRASQKVIEANGGVLVEEFVTPIALGGTRHFRYRVSVPQPR